MSQTLTPEQVLALAPDSAAATAARGLAAAGAWVALGRSEAAVWGECRGSAREPYRTQVDLSEPAFRCSCPSRKFPCKHALGLLLLLATRPELAPPAQPPPWVAEWLEARARASTRRPQVDQPTEAPSSTDTAAAEGRARAKAPKATAATREARVAAGMAELERWLQDQLRGGLAALQAEAPAAFDRFAARMVDAQAPGVARLLRAAGASATSGPGWQGRLLRRLAGLHLLARAYARLDALSPEARADVRATIGFAQGQEELLAGAGLRDRWLVLGRRVVDEDRLRVQRTWLLGTTSGRAALVLEFSAGGQPLDRSLLPGSCVDAELVFYPGAAPVRALVRARHGLIRDNFTLPTRPIREALGAFAEAIAANPWAERALLVAGPCTLATSEGRWLARDEAGHGLPLAAGFDAAWQLLACTAGRPFTLAGEWDGEAFSPLCAQQGARLVML